MEIIKKRDGKYEAEVLIENGRILEGELPNRARSIVREWAQIYKMELDEDRNLARAHKQLKRIPALE